MPATIEAPTVRRSPTIPREREIVRLPEPSLAPAPRRASAETVAQARSARVLALRELAVAIHRAELKYEETAELGVEFDRRLARARTFLRDAGCFSAD